jgi:hypothetical protein
MISAVLFGLALSAPAFAHAGSSGGGGASGGGSSGGGASGGGSSGGGASAGAGGGGGGSTGHVATPICAPGYAIVGGACVRLRAGLLPDDVLYTNGRALALAGYYTRALPMLEAIRRTDDPMVYTMRGYALRKLGKFDEAFALYAKALAVDPDNVNTHEYLGEEYVTTGRIDLARIELARVERGCGGVECEQYEDLERAINTGAVE